MHEQNLRRMDFIFRFISVSLLSVELRGLGNTLRAETIHFIAQACANRKKLNATRCWKSWKKQLAMDQLWKTQTAEFSFEVGLLLIVSSAGKKTHHQKANLLVHRVSRVLRQDLHVVVLVNQYQLREVVRDCSCATRLVLRRSNWEREGTMLFFSELQSSSAYTASRIMRGLPVFWICQGFTSNTHISCTP